MQCIDAVGSRPLLHRARSVKTSMTRMRRTLIVALGVAALAVPSAAIASSGENHGKGHSKVHNVAYVFKGAYLGDGSVEVKAGNSRVRKGGFLGATVSFDLSASRIVVADTNADGTSDLSDVQAGDTVVVKAMLPKSDPGTQPFAAKRLVDQTHPAE
jgi:hypothetical protein